MDELEQKLANAAVDNGQPSCIPGPWCLNCTASCIEDLSEDLQEKAQKRWADKAKELWAKKTA